MKTLAERIRASRVKCGLSQMELAEQTQLTQQMISKLESGTSQSTSAIFAIAKTLAVSAHWLWLGKDTPTSSSLFYNDEIVNNAWKALTDQQRTDVCEYILKISKDQTIKKTKTQTTEQLKLSSKQRPCIIQRHLKS